MNRHATGFTIIETIIVICIVAILASIAWPHLFGERSSPAQSVSYGHNGPVETRCIDGFKFTVGARGNPAQVLDEHGRGMPCEKRGASK